LTALKLKPTLRVMTRKLETERAYQILKLMQETKKAYTIKELCNHFKLHTEQVKRAIAHINRAGGLEIDAMRQPYVYKWNGKTTPTIHPPFEFIEDTQKEISIRENCMDMFTKLAEWEMPATAMPSPIIYAAIFCMGLSDPDYIASYNEWLEQAAIKLRQYHLAYRIIQTIQSLPQQKRKLETWGIQFKKEEPFIDLAMIYHARLAELLERIP